MADIQKRSDASAIVYNHVGAFEYSPRSVPAIIEYFEFGRRVWPRPCVVLVHVTSGSYEGGYHDEALLVGDGA